MPAPAAPATTLPAALLASRTLESVIRFLMPYFSIDCPDFAATRAEILENLASYAPRDRAELFATAKLIACTMTALSAMAEAEGADLSPALRLRFRTCANTVNRHANQAQQTLDKCQAQPIQPEHDPIEAAAKDAEVIEQLRQVKLMIETSRQRLAETDPEAASRLYPPQLTADEPPAWVRESLAAARATHRRHPARRRAGRLTPDRPAA